MLQFRWPKCLHVCYSWSLNNTKTYLFKITRLVPIYSLRKWDRGYFQWKNGRRPKFPSVELTKSRVSCGTTACISHTWCCQSIQTIKSTTHIIFHASVAPKKVENGYFSLKHHRRQILCLRRIAKRLERFSGNIQSGVLRYHSRLLFGTCPLRYTAHHIDETSICSLVTPFLDQKKD